MSGLQIVPPVIHIRPYRLDDADELLAAVRESLDELQPWMPWCRSDYSRKDALEWIEQTKTGRTNGTLYDFAIIADEQLAGGCGIHHINALDRVANLGYWVRTTQVGQGIATAAVTQVLRWTFDRTDLNRIEIVVAVDNYNSQRVAERVGAQRDAVLSMRTMVRGRPSDAVLYSVLRQDDATGSTT